MKTFITIIAIIIATTICFLLKTERHVSYIVNAITAIVVYFASAFIIEWIKDRRNQKRAERP